MNWSEWWQLAVPVVVLAAILTGVEWAARNAVREIRSELAQIKAAQRDKERRAKGKTVSTETATKPHALLGPTRTLDGNWSGSCRDCKFWTGYGSRAGTLRKMHAHSQDTTTREP